VSGDGILAIEDVTLSARMIRFNCSVSYVLTCDTTTVVTCSGLVGSYRFISELTQDGPGEKYPSAMGHMVATV